MRCLLVGYGEIGEAIKKVFGKTHDIDVIDTGKDINEAKAGKRYTLLLVAIGWNNGFIETVKSYQREYRVRDTLIFSTVPIGTSRKCCASHCPVEGKHPDLSRSIRLTDKWLGGSGKDYSYKFLKQAGFKIRVLDSEHTEFLKLRSTTVYGLNIEFARYSKACCDVLELNYDEVKEWDKWVNDLYHKMNMDWATRYILDPPVGKKGGHCVTPNAKILNNVFPSALVKTVAEE